MAKGYKTGGRQAGTPNKSNKELKELTGHYAGDAVAVIAELMLKGQSEQVRLKAAQIMLERACGKPISESLNPALIETLNSKEASTGDREAAAEIIAALKGNI